MASRRQLLKLALATVLSAGAQVRLGPPPLVSVEAQVPGGTLDPTSIPKYVTPLVKPPAMPVSSTDAAADYYEIAVRQFDQHILPASMGLPMTTVWSYGAVNAAGTVAQGGSFNCPAFTIEATYGKPTVIKWINDLVDSAGHYLPHLLPIDQTLHWANPSGGATRRDRRGTNPAPYTGPVPIITHVHGAHTREYSDGYPEAWYLPAADNIPAGYATTGTWYDAFVDKYGLQWDPGSATFTYPNHQRATTLWYHDHTLGMTRANVYAGPAGFYLLRGGEDDQVTGTLPGPAPVAGSDPFATFYEIPIVIQDRSFNADASLFYPDNRAFFEGLTPAQLQIPFIPDNGCIGLPSDVSPIWNPEFFGNTMVVNGSTWPYLEVEPRRYRFRLLNGCDSRFLILKLSNDLPFYQIGSEGGFLPAPVPLTQLLIAPAERADVIVDFTGIPAGTELILQNLGPDEPFGGGVPGVDFVPADAGTTGQVMQFRVVAATGVDDSTPVDELVLPAITRLPAATLTRQLSLNEEESQTVWVSTDSQGNVVLDCNSSEHFGPTAAKLGTVEESTGVGEPLMWMSPVTETPSAGDTEIWEIHNFTEDAHPIHVHLVQFEVIDREDRSTHAKRDPESWETGFKDTVIAYPGEITRIKARFDMAGQFVWHCHILEHEDNEMMRPYRVEERQIYLPFVGND